MNLIDECCHEWAARALGLARQQLGRPPHYPHHLAYWPVGYNNLEIRVLANRIIRTRTAESQQE